MKHTLRIAAHFALSVGWASLFAPLAGAETDRELTPSEKKFPEDIKAQLEQLGVPVKLEIFDEGGHGVGNLIPQRYKNGFPGAQWPKLVIK